MNIKEHSYSEIINTPLQDMRRSLAHAFTQGSFEVDNFLDVVSKLQAINNQSEQLNKQIDLAINAVNTGYITGSPDLTNSKNQFLWAAALVCCICDKTVIEKWADEYKSERIDDTQIWQSIISSSFMQKELGEKRKEVANTVKRSTVTVGWQAAHDGYPDGAYYYNSANDYINLDPVWGLIFGIEHARGATLHEVAHGQGSLFFTPKIQALYDQMVEMQKEQDAWGKEDYFKFAKLYAEWRTRFLIYDEAENNYANRFAANRGLYAAQNYGRSLNYIEACLSGIFISETIHSSESDIEKAASELDENVMIKLRNFTKVLRYVFFKNNGFIDDNEEGWRNVGVDLKLLEKSMKDAFPMTKSWRNIIDEIVLQCEKLEKLQPEPSDRMYGVDYFTSKVRQFCKERNQIIDEIFECYVAHFLPEIMQEVDKQSDLIMEIIAAIEAGKASGKQTIFIEGLGEISIANAPSQTPSEEKIGQGHEHEKTLDDKFDKPDQHSSMEKVSDPSTGRGGKGTSGRFSDKKLEVPEGGELSGYFEIISAYSSPIRKLGRQFREIEERFYQTKDDEVPRNVLIPDDGDISKFDGSSFYERQLKQYTGQDIGQNDFEHFRHVSPQRMDYPPAEALIYIDGSGSMSGEPLRIGMTAGCILYEAARSSGMGVYVGMMGSPNPMEIAKPHDNHAEIGKKMDAAKRGAGGNNDFVLPCLTLSMEYTLNARRPQHLVGNSHVFIVSDGGYGDFYHGGEKTRGFIELIGKKCPHLTMDYILIGDRMAGIIETAKKINRSNSKTKVGYRVITDMSEVSNALNEILTERLRSTKESDGILFTEKQMEFRAVHNKIKNKGVTANAKYTI